MANKSIGDFQKLAGAGPQPVPAGDYAVEVVGATFVEPEGKNHYFKVVGAVLQGEYAKKKLFTNIVLAESEGSASWFFGKMEALGIPRAYWEGHGDETLATVAPEVCQYLIGRKATFSVILKPFGERETNEVTKILPPGTAPATLSGLPVAAAPAVAAPTLTGGYTAPAPRAGTPSLPQGL